MSKKTNSKIASFTKELESRKKTFQDTGQAVHASALQEVEQERETEIEVETWVLYAASPEAAIIVTPEEAEHLIEIIQSAEKEKRAIPTRLLTYAAPVTRRMMHFNKLTFYSMPPLPADWQPSEWLTTELGLFAGRLYFEFSEYDSVCRILGIDLSQPGIDELDSSETDTTEQYSTSAPENSSGETSQNSGELREIVEVPLDEAKMKSKSVTPTLTSKPYTFTQEYLAVRRRGQDFTHTPMGFLSSGKPLTKDSPFFRLADTTRHGQSLVPVGITQSDDQDRDEAEDMMDLGNYDPSAEVQEDEEQITIEYDESELHPVVEEDDSSTDTEPSGRGDGQRSSKQKSKRGRSTAS
ncbi:hypothetical protein PC116_g29797 [Phytophthora cactorum]|nr:hypothetical protein PC116_g29797 [Phytophthora cactorum]